MLANQDGTEHHDRDTGNDLEAAEAHLHRAEADLGAAQMAERKAENEIDAAVHEIREAEDHSHEIHFTVDGEEYETHHRKLTANQIISEFGKQDPATNYLVEIQGTHKVSYQGKGDEEIKLRDCMSFQIISTGPKPVSDSTWAVAFAEGLRTLGYEPQALPNLPDHVFFNYLVEIGRFVGQTVRLGFIVPPDFPNIPPGGPHVSPHIQPIHPANDVPHPTGAASINQARHPSRRGREAIGSIGPAPL
ncbi:MAG: hypothetical protein ACRD2B_04950 [Terriglobia bacterium]